MIEAALLYAGMGWRVFPVQPGGKRPLPGSHGCLDATTDAETIRRWWGAVPDANIGLATGAGSGLIVVDLDTGKTEGVDGKKNVKALDSGPAPTWEVKTPSGGLHRYHLHPGGTLNNRAGVVPGVDVRGDGGYVLAPPSVVDGRAYVELGDGTIHLAPCPQWVTEYRAPEKAAEPPPRPIDRRPGETTRYGAAAMDGELGAMRTTPEGQRNAQLFKSTANLTELTEGGEIGSYGEWWDALRAAAIGTGLAAGEVDRTMQSGKTRDTPRRAPEQSPATAPNGVQVVPVAGRVRWLGDTWADFIGRLREEPRPPCPTGLDALDGMLGGGLPCGRFTLLAGGPGLGKTTLAIQIAMEAARKGWPVAFASYEMPSDEIRARIVCQVSGRTSWESVRQRIPSAVEDAAGAREHVDGLRVCLLDADDIPTLDALEGAIGAIATAAGREPLVIVDYAQDLMRLMQGAGEARQQAGAVGYWFRELAKRRQCPVCLLSSVGRGAYALMGKDGRPDLDRALGVAKESGDIEYHAGAVAVLCRAAGEDPGERPTWIALAKNRGGSVGCVPCKYNGLSGIFNEVEEADMPGGVSDEEIDAAILAAAKEYRATSMRALLGKVAGANSNRKWARGKLLMAGGKLAKVDGAIRPAGEN